MKKIAFIPIDNRPVCYTLPLQTVACDEDLSLLMPPRKMLGDLTKCADINEILNWLESIEHVQTLILSLDTLVYGGLIPSRRSSDTVEQIKTRLDEIESVLKEKADRIYAVSSIMRISNNNVNEEEKEYWSKYGKKIFEYSFNLCKFGQAETDVPKEILEDYLGTRKRNFEINKIFLNWAEKGLFEQLIFSKDDCSEFGLNVKEACELNSIIEHKKLKNAKVKTGADEIPISLLSRAIVDMNLDSGKEAPKISPKFLAPHGVNLISNYEDISIKECVEGQIELSGAKICTENSDITLIVNNFEEKQGEIVMGIDTKPYLDDFDLPQTPYMIADVRFANGADNKFVKNLFNKILNFDYFYGYSAWNTSANSIGTLICCAIVRFYAKNFNIKAFKRLQFIRFADDWAYQANVRQGLKKEFVLPEKEPLKKEMLVFTKKINKALKTDIKADFSYPWNRFFEVEVETK